MYLFDRGRHWIFSQKVDVSFQKWTFLKMSKKKNTLQKLEKKSVVTISG